MATVQLLQVRKSFASTEIIQGVDLTIHDRQLTVFVGPSGCGKSTLLRLIAGLEDITSGELLIDGKRVNEVPPARRGLALVFQSYALYPHMTVAENMSFSLKLAGASKMDIEAKVQEAARILHLEEYLSRKPKELSGGQRQRVAIGRAIVRNPRVFLFDEPLSNLDAALRVRMRLELTSLHRRLQATMIYVTHDQVEAMTMADRIVVMRSGRIEQVGSPMELYRSPRNLFVAEFIGSPRMNFLRATVQQQDGSGVLLNIEGASLVRSRSFATLQASGQVLTLGVRPEHLSLVSDGGLPVEVQAVEHLGGESYLHVATTNDTTLVAKVNGETAVQVGERVSLAIDPSRIHLFSSNGDALPRTALNPVL